MTANFSKFKKFSRIKHKTEENQFISNFYLFTQRLPTATATWSRIADAVCGPPIHAATNSIFLGWIAVLCCKYKKTLISPTKCQKIIFNSNHIIDLQIALVHTREIWLLLEVAVASCWTTTVHRSNYSSLTGIRKNGGVCFQGKGMNILAYTKSRMRTEFALSYSTKRSHYFS